MAGPSRRVPRPRTPLRRRRRSDCRGSSRRRAARSSCASRKRDELLVHRMDDVGLAASSLVGEHGEEQVVVAPGARTRQVGADRGTASSCRSREARTARWRAARASSLAPTAPSGTSSGRRAAGGLCVRVSVIGSLLGQAQRAGRGRVARPRSRPGRRSGRARSSAISIVDAESSLTSTTMWPAYSENASAPWGLRRPSTSSDRSKTALGRGENEKTRNHSRLSPS